MNFTRKKNISLIITGIIIIIFTYFYDLIVGKEEIILGPKSIPLIILGIVLLVIGLVNLKKK